jgi:uncharacterized protein
MEDEQAAWLKRRAACGTDRACLSKAYWDRVQELRHRLTAPRKFMLSIQGARSVTYDNALMHLRVPAYSSVGVSSTTVTIDAD